MNEEIKNIIESQLVLESRERQKEIAQRAKDVCKSLDGLSVSEIEVVMKAVETVLHGYSFFKV